MAKIKVIQYIPGFNMGGIESRLIDWYKNMDRNIVEFIVIKNNNINSEKLKEFIELGGRYYNLPHFDMTNLKKYIKGLREILKKERPDIVHVHSLSSGIFVLYMAKKLGVKTRILHSRTTDYLPNEKNVLVKKFLRILTPRWATHYFACSKEAGIWGIGNKKINEVSVIKNGIDLPKFCYNETIRDNKRKELNIKNNDIVIGTVGRLCGQKNLNFLIEVFNEVYRKNQNYRLVIVGDGDKYEEITNSIKYHNLENAVMLVGAHSDVWNYYMAFDIFLGTSLYEGFGTTAIEAQATGLPTILSDGFPETVEITDYIQRISLKNDAKIWAEKILNIEERKRTNQDVKLIEEAGYSAKIVAKELQEFYVREGIMSKAKLRKAEKWLYKQKMGGKLKKKLYNKLLRIVFSCDFPTTTKIGKGIMLPHNGLGVVIHPKAEIGNYCVIYQNVTLGGNARIDKDGVIKNAGAPKLEDGVAVFTGACVLGPIIIGHDSYIGANAVVTKDVPPNSIVVGYNQIKERNFEYNFGR